MSWLTKLRLYLGQDDPPSDTSADVGLKQAQLAYEKAEKALQEAQARRERMLEVTESLANLRTRNHFGESIEIAMLRRGR